MTAAPLTIAEVNALDREGFVAALGHVFEATPSLAELASTRGPFADRDQLVVAFTDAADVLEPDEVLDLLRAHPQLATSGPMTAQSTAEQRGAGLSKLADDQRQRIRTANARYFERFGFPFVIAVRGLTPDDVEGALQERLGHDEPTERAAALEQVKRIATLRIEDAVAP